MKFMSAQEIIEEYKKGRRNFSNIVCRNSYLRQSDFSGAIFRNADFSGTSFRCSNLTNADFTGAKFFWSSLRHCVLRNTKFAGASMIWCSFEDAILENTDFRKADLSNSLFYGCERFKGNFDGADLSNVIWNENDLSSIDIDEQIRTLQRAGVSLDRILYIKSKIEQQKNKLFGIIPLPRKTKIGYGEISKLYSMDIKQTSGTGYMEKKSIYSAVSGYVKKLEYGVEKMKALKEMLKEMAGRKE